jgi:hypothetical protein
MTGLCVQIWMAWLLIYSYSFAGANGYQELGRALRHRSPIDIVFPDVDVPPEEIGPAGSVPDGANPDAGDPNAGDPNEGNPNEGNPDIFNPGRGPDALPTCK